MTRAVVGPIDQAVSDRAVYAGPEALVARTRRLAVIGDTQSTALLERLVGLEQNEHHRPLLFAEMHRREPDGVLHLGDLVTWGSSEAHWRKLDAELAALRDAGVPVMPVVGNHDRMWLARAGLSRLRARFPVLAERTWYTFRCADVAFLALDSNLGPTERAARLAQERWLERTLAEADADPDVRAVIAYWHHPPFTNSRVVRPSSLAVDRFVPALASSKKALACFTGHCHAFEHFRERGLDFFVSGGGGGPRHLLETRPHRRRTHDHFEGGHRRFLHFIDLHLGERSVSVEVVRFDQASAGFDVAARVALPHR